MTQQNAALVEEAAAAAQSMQDQAGSLSLAVSVFKLSGIDRAATPAMRAPSNSAKPAPAPKLAAARTTPLPKAAAPKKLSTGKPPSTGSLKQGDSSTDWEEF